MARKRNGRPVHGILLLDKPSGGSSNHALQRAKRIFFAQKAGHTGSLDPLATGMLPICFGEATKISAHLLDADKGYEVTLKLGETTDSADADGELMESKPVPAYLDADSFKQICDQFKGPIMQIPPMVSAIKIDGQRLYKLARKGEVVERPARPVTIHALDVLSFSGHVARLSVRCSKGTYIRSLVTDIGEAIACGAHVTALRRTFVSPFEQRPMIELAVLEQMLEQLSEDAPDGPGSSDAVEKAVRAGVTSISEGAAAALDALLLPIDAALGHLPAIHLIAGEQQAFVSGNPALCQPEQLPTLSATSHCRVYTQTGELLGLGERVPSGLSEAGETAHRVTPRRVFQWH